MATTRRLFFDDGRSRKGWQVEQKGRTQTVRFGRLGGSLRESQKQFASPKAAAADTEKLIAKKLREGYIEIDPGRLEIARPAGKKAATRQAVSTFEKQVGPLPQEYRDFLRNGGGQPNPRYIRIEGAPMIDNVGVDEIYGLFGSKSFPFDLQFRIKLHGPVLPEGHLPVAGSGDIFTLSLQPKTFGCVYWWNHEIDTSEHDEKFVESDKYLVAGSFDEFLTRIATFFDDEEQDEGEPQQPASGKVSYRRLIKLMQHDHTSAKIKEIKQEIAAIGGDLSGIEDGQWPFINVCNATLLRALLNAGLNPEILDKEGHSLFWQTASNAKCIEVMLKRDADWERRSGADSETPLMRAIFCGSAEAVKTLLDAGAKPTVRLSYPHNSALRQDPRKDKLIDRAREKWKKKKAAKKKKPSSRKNKTTVTANKKAGKKPAGRKRK